MDTGYYAPRTAVHAVHWPTPDKNGDGDQVLENKYDPAGNFLGQNFVTDPLGNAVRHYLPPEGYANRPSSDGTENYVKVDGRGNVVRQPNGEAICARPGRSIITDSRGNVTYLDDDYSRYLWELHHDSTDEPLPKAVPVKTQAPLPSVSVPADQMDQFLAWQRAQDGA